MILVSRAVGALFAAFAFAFALSVFAVPMLLTERTDVMLPLAASMAMVRANPPVMVVWCAIVLGLSLSAATAFPGLVVVFPALGHAARPAHRALRRPPEEGETERVLIPPV